VSFVERGRQAGITFQHTDGSSGKYYIVETLASGVALFDFDLDGDLDIYFINGRPLPPSPEGNAAAANALYRNDGNGAFTDVTREKGVPGTGFGVGAAAADHDGDGDLDLYVCQFGPNVLYRNNGAGAGWTFTEVTREAGCDDPRFSAAACFFDLDRDGDLDLYVTNYCVEDFSRSKPCSTNGIATYCPPGQYPAEGHSLFRNRGDGTFEDITATSGVGALRGRGMGVVSEDFDGDGLADLYVANDTSDNFFLRNLGEGKFENIALTAGVALSANGDELGSMGIDVGDCNRDGKFDIIVTTFQKQLNALYVGMRKNFFVDIAMKQGLGETCLPMVSWGTKFADFDNDTWLDLFIANGHLEDQIDRFDQSSSYLQQNQYFKNLGGGVFKDVSNEVGPGLKEKLSSRGAAFGDIDNDGDIDIVVSNSRGRPSLLINEGGNTRSWIELELRGRKNRFAIGATARVTTGGVTQMATVRSGASYASQNDLRLHFGLGAAETAETIEVRWPEGQVEVFGPLAARRLHRLEEGAGTKTLRP
jgi:hypothetical protein